VILDMLELVGKYTVLIMEVVLSLFDDNDDDNWPDQLRTN